MIVEGVVALCMFISGELKEHRDGTKSVYIKDPSDNTIEMLQD